LSPPPEDKGQRIHPFTAISYDPISMRLCPCLYDPLRRFDSILSLISLPLVFSAFRSWTVNHPLLMLHHINPPRRHPRFQRSTLNSHCPSTILSSLLHIFHSAALHLSRCWSPGSSHKHALSMSSILRILSSVSLQYYAF